MIFASLAGPTRSSSFCPADKTLVEVINDVYTPTAEEIAEYRETIPLLEAAEKEGTVAWKSGSKTYDTAGLERARDLMDLARRLGLV